MRRISILIGPKGRGSNMVAIAEACKAGIIPATILAIVSPTDSTSAVDTAKRMGLKVAVCSPASETYAQDLLYAVRGSDILCLAGYLRLLPPEVLTAFPGRVLNIHPALLPKFGGKGMFGRHVHEAVIAASETVSGCTVHFVTEFYDEGAIILQRSCPVFEDDTPETLADRVLKEEHQAYPEAIVQVIQQLESRN